MKTLLSKKIMINWLISKLTMSPIKLQKMLYYEYSWCLAFFNSNISDDQFRYELFPARFQAWIHGPVIAEVYHEFKNKGYDDSGCHNIPKDFKLKDMDSVVVKYLVNNKHFNTKDAKDVLKVIYSIFNAYKRYSGSKLAFMTHQDAPWKVARRNLKPFTPSQHLLSNRIIYNYYSKLLEN